MVPRWTFCNGPRTTQSFSLKSLLSFHQQLPSLYSALLQSYRKLNLSPNCSTNVWKENNYLETEALVVHSVFPGGHTVVVMVLGLYSVSFLFYFKGSLTCRVCFHCAALLSLTAWPGAWWERPVDRCSKAAEKYPTWQQVQCRLISSTFQERSDSSAAGLMCDTVGQTLPDLFRLRLITKLSLC